MFEGYIKRINNLDKKKVGIVVLLVYSILIIVGLLFHEPWFDESHAYMIAKYASLKDIIFDIPHSEGHPPLWHLILFVPAKLGVPVGITLKSIQFITAVAMVYLIEFKSPFSNLTRIIIPFVYHVVFQYGVISRPYALLSVFLLLVAVTFKSRKEHPVRLVVCLALLCSVHAFGVAFAGGVSICLLIDILLEKGCNIVTKIKKYSILLISLAVLLLFALFLLWLVYPKTSAGLNTDFKRLWIIFLIHPSEVFFTDFFMMDDFVYNQENLIKTIVCVIISLLIWAGLIAFAYRRKILHYLLIPYSLVSVVMAIQGWQHHRSFIFFEILFVIMIGIEIMPLQLNVSKVKVGFAVIAAIYVLIGAWWTIISYSMEIAYPYAEGKAVASFITDNNLQDKKWLALWELEPSCQTGMITENISAYLGDCLNYNLTDGKPYEYFAVDASYEDIVNEWKKEGPPDFVISNSRVSQLHDKELNELGINPDDLVLVYSFVSLNTYKTHMGKVTTDIYQVVPQ